MSEKIEAKFMGKVVGEASCEETDEGVIINITMNDSEDAQRIWEALNDKECGYSLHDDFDNDADMSFQQDLAQVINRHSRENVSGTPDFVLAAYLESCLTAFEIANQQRADFRGEKVEFNPSAKFDDFDIQHNYVAMMPDPVHTRIVSFGPSLDGMGTIESVDGKKIE